MADAIPRGTAVGIGGLAAGWVGRRPSFPNLRGLSVRVSRSIEHASHISTTVSGREQRLSRRGVPRYLYQMSVEVLDASTGDVDAFVGFVESVRGRGDTFTFDDPYDGVVRTCRLDSDAAAITRIVNGLWSSAKLDVVTVKLGEAPAAPLGTAVFPTFRGVKIDVEREMFFNNTVALDPESGREQVTSWYSIPRWRYRLSVEFLEAAASETEAFTRFVIDHHGSLTNFLFTDPVDGAARTCRFTDDQAPTTQIVNGIWEVSNLGMVSVS